jgi:hypothetical protein
MFVVVAIVLLIQGLQSNTQNGSLRVNSCCSMRRITQPAPRELARFKRTPLPVLREFACCMWGGFSRCEEVPRNASHFPRTLSSAIFVVYSSEGAFLACLSK